MYQHAMQVAAGSVPEGYKWLSSLLGIRGNITNGMSGLRNFLADTSPDAGLFRNEAIFFYCYLSYYIENNKEGVLAFIRDQKLDVKNNHLFAYLATNLSIHNQKAAAALQILEGRNLSAEYLQTPVWDLEKGYALLARQDPAAATSLDRFIKDFKGKYYVKDALQKLSWHYYLAGDHERAGQYREQLLAAPDSGSEADKQAQREAESGTWPNKILLRARLLNDGGYQRDALRLLHGKSDKDFAGIKDRLEFLYRAGRVYDDLGSGREAIHFYKQAVDLGTSREEYFASRAALQIGLIYEKQARFKLAADWFRTAIAMKNHEYKNSIDQRAKAGAFRSENALKASNNVP
jgi:tetratricopeptide (TPR) repeat protein